MCESGCVCLRASTQCTDFSLGSISGDDEGRAVTKNRKKWTSLAAVLCTSAMAITAISVGSAGASAGRAGNAAHVSGPVNGGTATVDMPGYPNSLDPQEGYTLNAGEADWIVYTPLLTYAHKSGLAGTQIIPGLATALPVVTDNGTTYTLTLRKGLEYSNGTAVVASDFKFAVERALKLNWGASSFLLVIQGAGAYQSGHASTLTGITTDDATGRITIKLTSSYGAFDNVLCFPALSPVPQTTPMTVQTTHLPPGVGAYTIENIVPDVSFDLVQNPLFAKFHIPGIPLGHLNEIKVEVESNSVSAAEAVLDNQVDAFDVTGNIPPSLLGTIESRASSRFAKVIVASTDYFFLNESMAPFNNEQARIAVSYAVDRNALARLGGGFTVPDCYFVPVGIPGHPTTPCPYPSPNLAKAKALVKAANLVGTKVSVYGWSQSPGEQQVEYYASVLTSIGFKVDLKIINPSIYWSTIGNVKTAAQTGIAGQFLDFPNPGDFFLLLDARNIHPVNSDNFGNVNDPHLQATIVRLEQVPASQLASVANQWAALSVYAAQKVLAYTWGSSQLPEFLSNRINFKTAVFQPLFMDDWSSWELNS